MASWTEFGDDDAKAFSGTARYSITFNKPLAQTDDWVLDLGRVCESARVKLNGKMIGTLYSRPFRIRLGDVLRDGENHLELEVTNLMANRMIDMDRRGVKWCNYFFIYMTKKPPRTWQPLPSGLLGPVTLAPMKNNAGRECARKQN